MIRPAVSSEPSPIVFQNQWRDVFDGTLPEGWEPTKSVSVVIAAYNSATLPLTLASLAAQDYPQDLLEVVVVDDGSEPPVELGDVVPENLRLIRVEEGWGRSNATDIGIKATTGDIIYWVDSDMILFRDNVRQHAKWAHFIPEAATIGDKGFIESWDYTPETVYQKVLDGTIGDDYDRSTLHEHWSIQIYRDTDDLNASHGRNYSTHMGACASVTREVYDRTSGQDTRLHLGEDTEIAYQLWQAGAVFIPVHEALTWHLGPGTVQNHAAKVARVNDAHFAQRMPIPRYRRTSDNRIWEVPLVKVVVEVTPETAHLARNCVDRVLTSTLTDVHVLLVGPWSTLDEGRRKMLADPRTELFLVQEWFRTDNRVLFAEEVPDTVFPAPYRVDLPVTVGVTSDSLMQMYRQIDGNRLGAVRYFTPGHTKDESVTIWDSAAVARSRRYLDGEAVLEDLVDRIWGFEWGSNDTAQLVDLREADLSERVTRVEPGVARLEAEIAVLREVAEPASLPRQIARRVNAMSGNRLAPAVRRVNARLGGAPAAALRRLRGILR
ncbi:glycosyltransferase [Microbacterium marinilacus]|uniref:glycosyltransferase n=1 Tax=Microbacterium marinilacus TaxID=415209 RepID=UPI001C8D730F|nr:glycosyltransferase family 2 protein [Microbacterium marinilacus]MBY0687206.1 glycosyltransferase family 2 protein [Microbacterium marinilacus]